MGNSVGAARPTGIMTAELFTQIVEKIRRETPEHRKKFLLNLICFATCIEGLFFFAAFAYVYFLRSKGLLNGLADGTNWVFRYESCHINFAFEVVATVRSEEPELFDEELEADIRRMLNEAKTFMNLSPSMAIFPGLAIAWAVLGLNLLGDGLRDALDPRMARIR